MPIHRNTCSQPTSASIRTRFLFFFVFRIVFAYTFFFHFWSHLFPHILTSVRRLRAPLFVYIIILFKFFCANLWLQYSANFSLAFFSFFWLLFCCRFGYNFPLFVNKISNFVDLLFMFRMKAMAAGCLSALWRSRPSAGRSVSIVPDCSKWLWCWVVHRSVALLRKETIRSALCFMCRIVDVTKRLLWIDIEPHLWRNPASRWD